MLGDKKAGAPTRPATASLQTILNCADHDQDDDIATIYENEKN